MGAIAVPILPGKLDTWKKWIGEMNGARSDEFADLNSRYELTRHRAYLQQNPDGEYLVIAVHDGPGSDAFLAKIAESDHPSDVWFKDMVQEIHGFDVSAPPPGPPPELFLDGS